MSTEFVTVKREVVEQVLSDMILISKWEGVGLVMPPVTERIAALSAALEQPGVEPVAGWKMVPGEPTLEMTMAFAKSFSIYDQKAKFPEALKAMLAAAPQPAQQEQLLTNAEVAEFRTHNLLHMTDGVLNEFARAIEQAVLKKNGLLL